MSRSSRTRRRRDAPARVAVLLGCLLGGFWSPASGAEEPAETSESTEPSLEAPAPPESEALSVGPNLVPTRGPWRPPPHTPGESDWLQLTSGEWLRGTIEGISDDTVYFDSEKLEDLEIDWEDVASLRSPARNTYRFVGRVIVTGTAGMVDDVIRIDTGTEIREFPRGKLFGMIQGGLREIDYWSLDLGAGLTQRSGNSDQIDTTAHLEVTRETPLTKARFSYQSAFSKVGGEEITNNQRATAQFAYYLSRRFSVLAPIAEGFRDRFQNIELRATIGVGVGYDIVDRPKAEWNVALGTAYQRTQFQKVEAGEARRDDDAALTFSSTVELDPTGDIEWDTSYGLQLIVTDLKKTNHHLQSVFSVDLFGPVDLDVAFVWDRIEGPKRDENGNLPERNDFRTTVGLSIEL